MAYGIKFYIPIINCRIYYKVRRRNNNYFNSYMKKIKHIMKYSL